MIRIRKGKLKNKKIKTDRFDCYFYNGWKYKRLRWYTPWQLGGWCSSYVRSVRVPRFLFKRKKRKKKLARARKQRVRLDAVRAQRREENVTSSIEDAKKGTHRFLLMSSRNKFSTEAAGLSRKFIKGNTVKKSFFSSKKAPKKKSRLVRVYS